MDHPANLHGPLRQGNSERQGFLMQLGKKWLMLAASRTCRNNRAVEPTQRQVEEWKGDAYLGRQMELQAIRVEHSVTADSDFQTAI